MSQSKDTDIQIKLKEEYSKLSREAQQLMGRILKRENEKLHMGKAHGIIEDLLDEIKNIVK